MPELASERTCTGCMACADKCPRRAISSHANSDGHRYVSVESALCVECGLCEKTCPVVNGRSYGDNSLRSDFFAGWSTSSFVRKNGATAGIFGALASEFIRNGGYVAGAVMDGLECKYLLTDKPDDIERLQGSKYTSSDPTGIYSAIYKLLREDKTVLFSGLPCHVAALLSFVPARLYAGLYTVDLICGGVSSPALIRRYARQHPAVKSIVSFRNKDHGWKPTGYRYSLKYRTDRGEVISERGGRNLVTDGFACELTDRYCCYDCRFARTHRNADLTIGDLWNDTRFKEEHYNGVSAIISHSAKGLELLQRSDIETHAIDPKDVLRNNHRIYNGRSLKSLFPERRILKFSLRYFTYPMLMRIYANNLKTANPLWWPFAAYRYLSFKLAFFFTKRRNRKILNSL